MGWPLRDWIGAGIPPGLLPRAEKPKRAEIPPAIAPEIEDLPPLPSWEDLQALLDEHRSEGLRLVGVRNEDDKQGFYLEYPEKWSGPQCFRAQNLFLKSVDDIDKIAHALPQVHHDPPTNEQGAVKRSRKKITPLLVKRYKLGRRWILAHMEELGAAGWSRQLLFKTGRFRHPLGEWGLAWSGPWESEDLTAAYLNTEGSVVFSLLRNGREVIQTVRLFI